MFHVELLSQGRRLKGFALFLPLIFLFVGCGVNKQSVQVPDYILRPNGIELIGAKEPLTAFIFENKLTALPIEQFLSNKFNADNFIERNYWVTIDKEKYKIIIYDYSEFEKYFGYSNFSVINEIPENAKKGDSRKFIAISMINSYNQDCLAEHSLFQNIAINYLKKLKDEFNNQ